MGAHESKMPEENRRSYLETIAENSEMSLTEVMEWYENWMKQNPSGSLGKKAFIEAMVKALPKYTKGTKL